MPWILQRVRVEVFVSKCAGDAFIHQRDADAFKTVAGDSLCKEFRGNPAQSSKVIGSWNSADCHGTPAIWDSQSSLAILGKIHPLKASHRRRRMEGLVSLCADEVNKREVRVGNQIVFSVHAQSYFVAHGLFSLCKRKFVELHQQAPNV